MENEGYLSANSTIRRNRQEFGSEDLARTTTSTVSSFSPRVSRFGVPFEPSSRNASPDQYSGVVDSNNVDVDDYASDDHSAGANALSTSISLLRSRLSFERLSLSLMSRNVLKCAIAYFLASLFTFSPIFSQFILGWNSDAPSASSHMVATIVVYFNPAKTVGAMMEADMFCLFGLLYSAFVCLISMSMFWWLEIKPGWEWVADIVALSWIGLSIGALAWMKVWMENPSFNTGKIVDLSLLSFLLIFYYSVVKEGGLETLLQVSGIIVCGSVIANLVCYLLWPQSAISNLQLSMTKTLESFSTLLPMLTRIFLLENDSKTMMGLDEIQSAVEAHQNSFTSLKKNLREAKSEWILTRAPREHEEYRTTQFYTSGRRSYEDSVDCLNRLAQHLNGLRSSTRLQYDITKAGIKRQSKLGKGKAVPDGDHGAEDEPEVLSTAVAMFGDLIDELGPPLKALSSAATSTLDRLRDVCSESRQKKKSHTNTIQPHEFSDLVEGIEAALLRFESTSNHAVLRLYRRSDANPLPLSTPTSESHSLAAESDNENVFLVYFFIFTLQEFAKELMRLVDSIEQVYCYEQRMLRRDPWWSRLTTLVRRTFANLKLSRKSAESYRKSLNIRRTYMIPPHRTPHPAFPKIRPHAPDTIQTPSRHQLSLIGKINQTLWIIGKRLKERDTKYAIKAGIATVVLAFPAFVDSTRPTFIDYWGDWALISFFVVISPTIGATNYLSFQRFLGTLFGAAVAAALYSLFPEDAVTLSIAGFIFSLPCFYFAVARPQYLSASRFVLLTYNLTCLFCYNLRQKDISVVDIAFHRALAVVAGILWAAFVSRFWWPAEARRELTKSLSEFCLHIGWLYTRLVASNSFAPEYREPGTEIGPSHRAVARQGQSTRLSNSIHEFMAMELHLQIKLIELQSLLAQTQHEPRLKGPFPVDLYRQILTSLQTILDKLHSMRCVTTREECVRRDFIIPVNKERREMVGNIMLSFSILSASFRLKAPLPPYLPPVENSRLRLVDAIRKLDVVKNRDVKVSRQLLFFAYALTMKGVTLELESLGRMLQNAFGVIGQTSEEFETLFLTPEESHGNIDCVA
ncbi:hypothetical protein GALMADRAFT_68130 [Galerina marginata CBS 339.88]|uniref:Uncharacterized protein n=1 Tax=Galerina marginata (strain CBS 339.88) TaxID=685588 RepID=A0A067SYG0_GALM3|nr:hypothetical protein GALMADRAFT_68130 [Galerina marginata CBS 339.88]